MKKTVTVLAIAGIILVLGWLAIWRGPAPEQAGGISGWRFLVAPRPVKTATEIDPPFGFHWGDSISHIEALLGYSGAHIVSRQIEGSSQFWNVEGLVQPGLKNTRFFFRNNSLSKVELHCQYDAWSQEQYKNRLEELRAFFDAKYHGGQRSTPIGAQNEEAGRERRLGYGWRFQNTKVRIFCRSFGNRPTSGLSVTDLIIRYDGQGGNFEPDSDDATNKRWLDEVASPLLGAKLSAGPDAIPPESILGIVESKLLNTSQTDQSAFALLLGVKLRPNTTIDSTKAVVQVNFYDSHRRPAARSH